MYRTTHNWAHIFLQVILIASVSSFSFFFFSKCLIPVKVLEGAVDDLPDSSTSRFRDPAIDSSGPSLDLLETLLIHALRPLDSQGERVGGLLDDLDGLRGDSSWLFTLPRLVAGFEAAKA